MSETSDRPVEKIPLHQQGGKAVLLMCVLIAGIVGFFLLLFWGYGSSSRHASRERPDSNPGSYGQRWDAKEAVASARPPVTDVVAAPKPEERRPREPVEVYVRPSSIAFNPVRAKPPSPPASAGKPQGPQTVAGMTILQGEGLSGTEWMLMPGTEIACSNVQPLANRAGARFSANIPEDVRGADGTRVLIPAGSLAIGQVAKAAERGDTRLPAVLTHIIGAKAPGDPRPQLVLPLGNAQAGDEVGGADLPANISSRWGERFASVAAYAALDLTTRAGSALLMNGIDNALSGGGDGRDININLGRFSNGGFGRSLAGREFEAEIAKPPLVDRPMAQPCTIFIAQPISLKRYYTGSN